MWRFKPFMQKEQTGLEGRFIDIGNLKIHVIKIIAEGGFSCVYLVRDAVHASKHYALKHIICNDEESLELVIKEINIVKSLRGHPNVVALYAHTILDMGRTKEAFLVMELCEKSLVSVLENRGAAYFDEKQILSIFRDVCNAVFAMHCQSPPIAHRDLKAENLLLGSEGFWKLCDFGSTSTNHKRFEKPEEMGIEEDNIRKYTTPAYRAPEMWDLFLRELISEKVDIWALGCLLFRICYLKSAFDGESKLQILNGNYRIPELPKYSSAITDLIRDMLRASPDARPDIAQVWFRVNEQLPVGLQKSLPDKPPEMHSPDVHEGHINPANKVLSPMPRSPSPPPSEESTRNTLQSSVPSRARGGLGQIGAFWSSQHSKDSVPEHKGGPKFDKEPTDQSTSKHYKSRPLGQSSPQNISPGKEENVQTRNTQKAATFQDDAFNTFVAEFDTNKLKSGIRNSKSVNEDMPTKVEKLNEQLKHVNLEKSEITSKYEKLVMICRSQRQEIQELKQALTARTPSPNKDVLRNPASSGVGPSVTSLQNRDKHSQSPEQKPWQPFADPKQQPSFSGSVRTTHQNNQTVQIPDTWGFGAESFTAAPSPSSYSSKCTDRGHNSQHIDEAKIMESKPASQPAGWAGF